MAEYIIQNGINTFHFLTGTPDGIGILILFVLLMGLADCADRMLNFFSDWKYEREYRAWKKSNALS